MSTIESCMGMGNPRVSAGFSTGMGTHSTEVVGSTRGRFTIMYWLCQLLPRDRIAIFQFKVKTSNWATLFTNLSTDSLQLLGPNVLWPHVDVLWSLCFVLMLHSQLSDLNCFYWTFIVSSVTWGETRTDDTDQHTADEFAVFFRDKIDSVRASTVSMPRY